MPDIEEAIFRAIAKFWTQDLKFTIPQLFQTFLGRNPTLQEHEWVLSLGKKSYGEAGLEILLSDAARTAVSQMVQQKLGILPRNIDYWIQRLAEKGYHSLEAEVEQLRKIGEPLLTELQDEVEDKEIENQKLQNEIKEKEIANQKLQGELKNEKSANKKLQNQVDEKETANKKLQEEVNQKEAANKKLRSELKEKETANEKLQNEITNKKLQTRNVARKAQVISLKDALKKREFKIAELEDKVANLEKQIDTLTVKNSIDGFLPGSANDNQSNIPWNLIFAGVGVGTFILVFVVAILLYNRYRHHADKKVIVMPEPVFEELPEKLPDKLQAEEINLKETEDEYATSEIKQWQELFGQIQAFLDNVELKKFISAQHNDFLNNYYQSIINDPMLSIDNNAVVPRELFKNYQEKLAFLQDHAKQLAKQQDKLEKTSNSQKLSRKKSSQNSPSFESEPRKVENELVKISTEPEGIKTPVEDDVPDTPSKRRLKNDVQNKILTELSESESDSVENTTLHEIVLKKNDSDLRKMLKEQKKFLKSKEEFRSFINEGNLDGNTALHFAIRRNDEKIVKRLIRERANVNYKNNLGETPLHKAAKHGYVNLTKLLVDAGADVDAVTYNKNTAMHYACDYLQSKMVEYLISVGVNIEIENTQRMTAFELLYAKQLSSEQTTIKKIFGEYKSLTLAKKIASKFRIVCELNSILGTKKKKKDLLKSLIVEVCKTNAKFHEWTSRNYRISEEERNNVAKAINQVTKKLSKKDFEGPELIKDQVKNIIEEAISDITSHPRKKPEPLLDQVVSKEPPSISSFRGALKELLHSSYTYYSLIICAIVVDPNISDNQLLEVIKGVAPLIISGAGQIVSSTVAPIPALQTGIQQSANIVGTLAPIAIGGIQAWLAKKDNIKRKAEAQHFVDAFIDKNSSSISFFNRQIPRIDQIKLDAIVNTMTERFEDQLLQLRPLHAEMLAQHIHARIVKHLLDNRDLFEGESELWIARKGKGLVGEVQDHIDPNRVKPTYLDLNKRCILAILRQGLGATHEQVLDINNKEVYLHGYIVWSGIKVKNKNGYELYDSEDEKTRIQHELYGYCLGTKEEVDIRGKFQFSKFVPLNKDQKSWESVRAVGFHVKANKLDDRGEELNKELERSGKEFT